jgi:hypothetical protein
MPRHRFHLAIQRICPKRVLSTFPFEHATIFP